MSEPAPGLSPARTTTTSSLPRATPCQCSASAAAFASFSTSTGQRNERRSRSPSLSPVHCGSAVPRRIVPSASTIPGPPDPHGAQRVPGDARAPQQLADRRAQPLDPVVGARRLLDLARGRAQLAALQVGDGRRDAVRADLQAQQVPRFGAEAVQAGRAALLARARVRGRLDDEPGGGQIVHRALDGGPRQPRQARDLGERAGPAAAQRVEDHGGVDPPQQRGITTGQPPHVPVLPARTLCGRIVQGGAPLGGGGVRTVRAL
ncbi:hypothetical protein GA0115246_106327 [Streptomyces sp. SolWspMP-sol7th]|nr:hypothetical protein GA0115246_106327 [Streptomyces sp. SolWspMP-sol7th]